MEAQQFNPCPWLLDGAGAVTPDRSRTASRCGADAARAELPQQIRERRCLVGAACEVRAAREAALGPLAATLAPQQPVGDAELLYGGEPLRREAARSRAQRSWRRPLLVVVLAALLVVGGGPALSFLQPIVGGLTGGSSDSSLTPSGEPSSDPAGGSPTASPDATPSESPALSPALSPTPTPAASATPSPSAESGTTYVVRKGDSLYGIACSLPIGCAAYKTLAELNGIAGPDYLIKAGQVLKLP